MAIGKLVQKDGKLLYSTGDLWSADDLTTCNCDCGFVCTSGCYGVHQIGQLYQYNIAEAFMVYFTSTGFWYPTWPADHPIILTSMQTQFSYPITAYNGAGPYPGIPMGEIVATINHKPLICPADLPYSSSVSWLFDCQAEYLASAWGAYPMKISYTDVFTGTTVLTSNYNFTTLTIPMDSNAVGVANHLLIVSAIAITGMFTEVLLGQFYIRFSVGACPILEP